MMRLFTRRHATVDAAPPWRPEGGDVKQVPADLMEGECAGGYAFGAPFHLDQLPRASLTIWAFAAPAGPVADNEYFIAYRVDYRSGPWNARSLYYGDVAFSEWYPDLEAASDAARESARSFLDEGTEAILHVDATVSAGWFDWDGTPW